MTTATHRTAAVTVEAVQFDGSMQRAYDLSIKQVKFNGATEPVWWSPATGVVDVGDWVIVSGYAPVVVPQQVFALYFASVDEPQPEDSRDLALRVAGDRIRDLEHELAQMTDQARRAREDLRASKEVPPEPTATVDWYSCAVCSRKTNEAPSAQICHACCLGVARVGPCCAKAVEKSPQVVGQVLDASNHRPDCNRPR